VIERIRSLREWALKMRHRNADESLPFGVRYKAAILAEDLEEEAQRLESRSQTDAA